MFSLLFLFGGMVAITLKGDDLSDKAIANRYDRSYNLQPVPVKYSMKQIDSLSSRSNYAFTSSNASGSTNLP